MSEFKKLLAPESIVIIGASRKEGSLGKMYLDAVLQFKYTGKIYIVNPKADQIEGIKCYPDIDALPEIPDLAIMLLPKDFVLQVTEQLAKKGIKNVVVISAGFKEVGGEGIEREKKLLEIVKSYGMRMVGPNSMGLFNTDRNLSFNGTFSPTPPLPGHVGFVSQSGALGVGVLELSIFKGLGFSIFVSIGNKIDISDVEILQYLYEDNNTNVAMLYQESIDNPIKFRQVCTSFIQKKPLLTLKAGRTQSGLKAASSHTGALVSDDGIIDIFLKQCGIIRCNTIEELMDTALLFEDQPLPKGNRIAIITNAGGPGILASDVLEKSKLQLAQFSKATITKLTELLPDEASITNPVDMIASATHETYRNVLNLIASDKNVDIIIIIIVTPPVNSNLGLIVEHLSDIVRLRKKTMVIIPMMLDDASGGFEIIRKLKIPAYIFPESAIVALGNMIEYLNLKKSVKPFYNNIQLKHEKRKVRQSSVQEILELFKKYKLPVCDNLITNDINEALSFLNKTKNVAMKVANPEIIHKSDSGLVMLNINKPDQLKNVFPQLLERIKKNLPAGIEPKIIIQKMVKGKIELVIGSRKDSQFGQVLMFGSGGTMVELFKDVAFRVLPIDRTEALELIKEIKAHKMLTGFRDIAPVNLNNLADLLVNIGRMLVENQQILEMDMNPLIWQEGVDYPTIVDFRMTVVN